MVAVHRTTITSACHSESEWIEGSRGEGYGRDEEVCRKGVEVDKIWAGTDSYIEFAKAVRDSVPVVVSGEPTHQPIRMKAKLKRNPTCGGGDVAEHDGIVQYKAEACA
jgi:hypothetical protein